MNVFALDVCPEKSARMLCNKHSIKMVVESAGMLAFVFPEGSTPIPNSRKNRHYIHPASIWARSSQENFDWLLNHFICQLDEYKSRYVRDHSYLHLKDWFLKNRHSLEFQNFALEPFARCFSSFSEKIKSKNIPNTIKGNVIAYRVFYHLDKASFAKWPSINKIPDWWIHKDVKPEMFVDKLFINGKYSKR